MGNSIRMFEVGNSGLQAAKQAISTTGHNIANVNTKGYSRQRIEQGSGPSLTNGRGTVGTGVRIHGVSRTNDEYLQRRIEKEQQNFGSTEERHTYLGQVEQVFNEANSDGINRLATQFFNEFRKLSVEPENQAVRAAIRESSKRLVGDIRRVNSELREVQNNIDFRLEGYTTEINSLAKEIRDLNQLIDKATLGGGEAPDLLDKREEAMTRLGEMVDISVAKDEANRVTITVGGRVAIVSGGNVTKLEVRRDPADLAAGKQEGLLSIWTDDAVPMNLTNHIKGGRTQALIEVRDADIKRAQDQINDVAFSLIKHVNDIHSKGYGLNNSTGINFFKEVSNFDSAAEQIQLSDEITADIENIATAKGPNSPGDNRIAIAITQLSTQAGLLSKSDRTISDMYSQMVGELGTKAAAAERGVLFQKDILAQLDNFRESISGVNLDEETSNLVRFQHAYSANANVLKVADEVIQSIFTAFR